MKRKTNKSRRTSLMNLFIEKTDTNQNKPTNTNNYNNTNNNNQQQIPANSLNLLPAPQSVIPS